jgi:type IV secretory pathway TraG/TraD family ATPase VirD4
VYGADNAQVLRDNMETQIYYRPDDLTTAEYLEKRAGKKSAYARSETQRESGEVSQGKSEQGISLMTAQDFMQMKDHHIILFHRNLPPIKAHRVSWIGNATYENYRKIPPPKLTSIPDCEVSLNTQTNQNIDGYVNPYMLLNRHKRTELEQELSN